MYQGSTYRPFIDKLLPVREPRQELHEVLPQLGPHPHVQIGLYPRHNKGLEERRR